MKKFGFTLFCGLFLCLFFSSQASAQFYAWGGNVFGQLGNNSTTDQPTPAMRTQDEVVAIGSGQRHTLAVRGDGTILAWGSNIVGQLGDNTVTQRLTPVVVHNLTDVNSVATGDFHSVALKDDGTVWVWGRNAAGELGQGTTDNNPHRLPLQVPGLTNIVAISANGYQTLALKDDGTVWAWGDNSDGQIGNNTMGNVVSSPVQVMNLTNVIQVATGTYHSVALKSDGTVWAWGFNGDGEIGNNSMTVNLLVPTQTTISGVTQIAAGYFNTAALKPNGTVFVWGSNLDGQIGNNTSGADVRLPVQSTITDVIEIKMHGVHVMARQRNGTVKVWGDNNYGQSGDGTSITDKLLPVTANVGTGVPIIGIGDSHSFSNVPHISTNTGTDIFLAGENVTFLFGSVTGFGSTTYTAIDPLTDPLVMSLTVPPGLTVAANQPAYNIQTTATFPGMVDVCLKATGEYSQLEFEDLHILHAEGGALVDRTLYTDFRFRRICARVSSFSPFVIAKKMVVTAANVTVTGKVLSGKNGIARATVSLTDSTGTVRTVKTNTFGNYVFEGIRAGETVIIQVSAKGYNFAPQIVTPNDDLAEVDFNSL